MIKKKKSSSKKINWFWAHQRNMTLLHMDLVGKGFRGKGYHPRLRFDFDNQIFVYVPKKGFYLFYDEDQIKKKMLQLQEDVQKNDKEILTYFNKKTNRFFGHLLMIGREIKNTNLTLCSNEELLDFFTQFKNAITVGPIITIQLWGIESCWLNESELTKSLKKKVKKEEFNFYKQKLSASIGKTIAYAEREEFLRVLVQISKNKLITYVIKKGNLEESKKILQNTKYQLLIKKHMDKYWWITAEYRSEPWDYMRWLQEIKNNIVGCEKNLKDHQDEFNKNLKEKISLVKKLKLSKKALKVLRYLDESNAQRDHSKGKFCEAYFYLRYLTDEICRRFDLTFNEIYSMKVEEVEQLLKIEIKVDKNILQERINKGFTLLIKSGKETLHKFNTLENLMKKENIHDFFNKKETITESRGLPANKGLVQGKARVIDSASKINEFQKGEILVTYMTTMEFTPLFSKAKAIVCDEGGISSHAAIVSREFNIPCIVGAKNTMKFVKTGDLIEVDANNGIVRILNKVTKNI